MKKFLFPLLMLLTLAACEKDAAKLAYVLTNENVKVNNLSQDYLVQVDNGARTIYIEVDYLDKAELAALQVEFVGLPDDVTANPASSTFNYAAEGASQKVELTQGKAKAEYVITAAAAAPQPHFVSIKLNGVDVASGIAKLKGSADLTKVSVSFVVSPANTVVKVGDEVIESASEEAPNAIDFSDKLNGVKFTLVCDEVKAEETVKVVTTGINKVNRLWGRYVKPVTADADAWWSAVIPASDQNMRTMTMDDKYIYLAKTNKTLFAVSITDPSNTKAMDMGEYAAGGGFGSCALASMENGNGGYVTLLSNMVNSTASEFVIWKWDSVDGKPTKVLSYHLPEAARIGDQMSVEGTWKNGKIWFHDFTSQQAAYVFTVTNGVISTTATKVSYDAKQGNWSAPSPRWPIRSISAEVPGQNHVSSRSTAPRRPPSWSFPAPTLPIRSTVSASLPSKNRSICPTSCSATSTRTASYASPNSTVRRSRPLWKPLVQPGSSVSATLSRTTSRLKRTEMDWATASSAPSTARFIFPPMCPAPAWPYSPSNNSFSTGMADRVRHPFFFIFAYVQTVPLSCLPSLRVLIRQTG